jgi:hypothetical protein
MRNLIARATERGVRRPNVNNTNSRRLFHWVLGSLICLEASYFFISMTNHTSVGIPFQGPIRKDVVILVPNEYTLWLDLNSAAPKNDLTKALDSIPWPTLTPPPISVPIKWSVSSGGQLIAEGLGGKQAILEGGIRSSGSDSRTAIALFRKVLGPGRYTVIAEPAPGFQSLVASSPRLLLQVHFKTAATWQSAAFNLFTIAQVIIVPIVFVMMVLVGCRRFKGNTPQPRAL